MSHAEKVGASCGKKKKVLMENPGKWQQRRRRKTNRTFLRREGGVKGLEWSESERREGRPSGRQAERKRRA